jgi:hypothetical protein
MSDRWPLLPEFLGLAVGSLIVVSLAIGLFFLAQILGATGLPLIAIGGGVSAAAAFVIGRAWRG